MVGSAFASAGHPASKRLRGAATATETESETAAYNRRVKESKTVEERVTSVFSADDLQRELQEVQACLPATHAAARSRRQPG